MSNLKKQDTIGIIAAIAITIVSVGFAIAGTAPTDMPQKQAQNIEVIGFGGITDAKESIKILLESKSIDLDTSNGFIRGNVVYEGFQPQMGLVYLEIFSPTGDKVNKSELQLRDRGNDVYEAEFTQYFDKSDFLNNNEKTGQYMMRISTEYGMLAKQTPFDVIMSSQEQPKINTVVMESNEEIGLGGILHEKKIRTGYDIGVMEKDLENTILKKYLTKVLKGYHNGDISKDDVEKLAEFKSIDCNFTDQTSQNKDVLQLSCEIIPEN
ncbi:hypothetical protein [Nitrosopumilus maritimus]|uniref:Uncharacterized protein n=1 Tax=Nitrosopumilus maritimus (strain SCM1) TaxID=436308 RepID=A9A4B1_NITMS|nr:hypothetical protein [Nitrosopumilus maritimus]ABX12600.1 hypothetical protein Nmar_0704 [Nitrosopumilus maritimus SCM1]